MKRSRFAEEQIIGVQRGHEAGAKDAALARKHGVSEATIYAWKAKFGGMTVSEAQRLKALEDDNARLKRLLAEAMLDKAALNEFLAKWLGPPPSAREGVADLRRVLEMSERWACAVIQAHRTSIRYRSRRPTEAELRERRKRCSQATALRGAGA
jgi:putative transposase